jgi:hypothetical protein
LINAHGDDGDGGRGFGAAVDDGASDGSVGW